MRYVIVTDGESFALKREMRGLFSKKAEILVLKGTGGYSAGEWWSLEDRYGSTIIARDMCWDKDRTIAEKALARFKAAEYSGKRKPVREGDSYLDHY